MYTLDYEFHPTDRVFVVISGTQIEAGVILNVKFDVYQDANDSIIERVMYTVLLDDTDEGTVFQDSATIFSTLTEAGDYVSNFLTPTPTVTVSITPTVTPTTSPSAV